MTQWLSMTQFSLMQELTDQLVQDFGFTSNSFAHVANIAQRVCGLRCVITKLTKKHSLSLRDASIYVDENCTPAECVLLVARTIGQCLLHEEINTSEWQSDHFLLKRLQQVLSSTKTKRKKDKIALREKECDEFAASLLVPRTTLHSYCQKYSIIDVVTINELASSFNVSPQLLFYRINQLHNYNMWQGVALDLKSLRDREVMLDDRVISHVQRKELVLPSESRNIDQQSRFSETQLCTTTQLKFF